MMAKFWCGLSSLICISRADALCRYLLAEAVKTISIRYAPGPDAVLRLLVHNHTIRTRRRRADGACAGRLRARHQSAGLRGPRGTSRPLSALARRPSPEPIHVREDCGRGLG